MKYTKNVSVSGDWVKAADLNSGQKACIMSETAPIQSGTFTNKDGSPKTQDVCKVVFEQFKDSVKNVSLNRATINALIDAFGDDSKNWMKQVLRVETEKMRVAGKAVTALYLIPDGYERVDDANGYAVIQKIGGGESEQTAPEEEIPTINLDDESEEIRIEDIPF